MSMVLFWSIGFGVFLLAYAVSTVWIVQRKIKECNPRQIASLYLLLKIIKLFVLFAAIGIYFLTVKVGTRQFLLITIVLYLLFLIFDTVYLTSVEKKLKKENEK